MNYDYNNDGVITPQEVQAALYQNQQNNQFFQWQLENQDIVNEIAHNLRGEFPVTDKEGYTRYQKLGMPKMNERGIREITSFLRAYSSKNIMLSKYNIDAIRQKMEDLHNALWNLMYWNLENWEMRTTDLYLTSCQIVDFIEASFYRAESGGERAIIGMTQRRVEQVTNNVAQRSRGITGAIGGMFNGGN